MPSKRVVLSVRIEWGNLDEKGYVTPAGDYVVLDHGDIARMERAALGLEELNRAIAVAKRLAELKG